MIKYLPYLAAIPLLITLYIGVSYLYYDHTEASDYIVYNDLYFDGLNEETPMFTSKTTVKKTVNVRWLDILRCDTTNTDRYVLFSQYISARKLIEPRDDQQDLPWAYNAHAPVGKDVPCYLDSVHCVQLPFGIEKCDKIETDTFVL